MKKMKNLRWYVVGLVALAAVINYIDRKALGVLWPFMGAEIYPDMDKFGLDNVYGTVSLVFLLAYAFGQALFGKIFDWIGTRLGFALSISVWSVSTALHALAQGILSFGLFRAMLGVSEAGNWPGAAKANAEWFPTKERALAQGIFNSGAAIGALVSIPLISGLAIILDWKVIFVLIGLLGLLWLIPWFAIVKSPPSSHPWITDDERHYIISGQKNEDENSQGYAPDTNQMLKHKESWAVIIMSAAIDPIWWLFVIWVPTYLVDVYQFDLKELAKFGWIPYFGAMLGAFFGGFLAKNRINSGWKLCFRHY